MEKYKCKKCNGLGMPSKAFLNTMVYFDDFGGDVGQRGTTGSRQGEAELVDVIKCQDCGHSWIPEKEVSNKYSVICFTFNKKEAKETIIGEMLTLRNNWVDEVNSYEELCDLLERFGFDNQILSNKDEVSFEKGVCKLSGDFTVANTRIIVHIIKN